MQVDKVVGKGAPTEFIEQMEDMVNTHHDRVEVDVIRAYHFGARFIVEVRTAVKYCLHRSCEGCRAVSYDSVCILHVGCRVPVFACPLNCLAAQMPLACGASLEAQRDMPSVCLPPQAGPVPVLVSEGGYSGLKSVKHAPCWFFMQVEVIMPATWSVKESHDVALQLQHKVGRT